MVVAKTQKCSSWERKFSILMRGRELNVLVLLRWSSKQVYYRNVLFSSSAFFYCFLADLSFQRGVRRFFVFPT